MAYILLFLSCWYVSVLRDREREKDRYLKISVVVVVVVVCVVRYLCSFGE